MIFIFSLGFSLLASVLYVKARDVQHILSIIFQAFFYLTPIIYPLNILPPSFHKIFLLNPFYYFVQLFRAPVYAGQLPSLRIFAVALALTAITFVTGWAVFFNREKSFVFDLS